MKREDRGEAIKARHDTTRHDAYETTDMLGRSESTAPRLPCSEEHDLQAKPSQAKPVLELVSVLVGTRFWQVFWLSRGCWDARGGVVRWRMEKGGSFTSLSLHSTSLHFTSLHFTARWGCAGTLSVGQQQRSHWVRTSSRLRIFSTLRTWASKLQPCDFAGTACERARVHQVSRPKTFARSLSRRPR